MTGVPKYCGTIGPRCCSTSGTQWYPVVPHGTQVQWYLSSVVPRYCCTQVMCYPRSVVPKKCGTMAPSGTVVPRYCSTYGTQWCPVAPQVLGYPVIPWYPSTLVPCTFESVVPRYLQLGYCIPNPGTVQVSRYFTPIQVAYPNPGIQMANWVLKKGSLFNKQVYLCQPGNLGDHYVGW